MPSTLDIVTSIVPMFMVMNMKSVKESRLKSAKVSSNGQYSNVPNEWMEWNLMCILLFCDSEELFLTSKLWNTFHRADLVIPALKTTLKNLATPYVDLYLIHWPFAYKEDGDLFPNDADGKIQFSSVDFLESWKELEKCVDAGLTKSIGISNFNKAQTQRVLDACRIKPVTNQVECHPYLNQDKLSKYLKSVGIVLIAYSPLGSPDRPWVTKDDPVLLDDPKVNEMPRYSITEIY